jgi:ABC-2 type transport system permease protein
MMADVWTIMWKEWKELLVRQGATRGGVLRLIVLLGALGILLPLQIGRGWTDSAMVVLFAAWNPFVLVTAVVADAFAGERERHTLETLLASRLPDRAILVGKTVTALSYGWGLTLVAQILGLISVNLAYGRGEALLYPPAIALSIAVSSFLSSGLAATAGVLVSLRAPTVRQAQQTMSIASMVLLFLPIYGIRALPAEWRSNLTHVLMGVNVRTAALAGAAFVAALDMGLFLAAIVRFRRARLILD